ncbi:hypothetical protein [Thermostaphylospora chromogena]|uniref:hypothetical protein n=1 Tax=Thermostaphylospora chromogena TaxID=35622 RepID=UPI00104222DB|nr:hypothetical protein [Thermostaphylospora chromogena]
MVVEGFGGVVVAEVADRDAEEAGQSLECLELRVVGAAGAELPNGGGGQLFTGCFGDGRGSFGVVARARTVGRPSVLNQPLDPLPERWWPWFVGCRRSHGDRSIHHQNTKSNRLDT